MGEGRGSPRITQVRVLTWEVGTLFDGTYIEGRYILMLTCSKSQSKKFICSLLDWRRDFLD